MTTVYIRFEAPQGVAPRQKSNVFRRSFSRVVKALLVRVVPSANPDFDRKIDDVKTWLVECDLETGVPDREIGLDGDGKVIVKLPDDRNMGYWTDNNLLLADFHHLFALTFVDPDTFNKYWQSVIA